MQFLADKAKYVSLKINIESIYSRFPFFDGQSDVPYPAVWLDYYSLNIPTIFFFDGQLVVPYPAVWMD